MTNPGPGLLPTITPSVRYMRGGRNAVSRAVYRDLADSGTMSPCLSKCDPTAPRPCLKHSPPLSMPLRGLTPGVLLGLITTQGAIECADEIKRHIDAARSNGKIWN